MTWTDLSGAFGYGTKLTSSQMQQLRDNITAVPNGDAGAPAIQSEALDSAIVNRDAMKISTGSATGSIVASNYVDINMQDYCLFPNIATNDPGKQYMNVMSYYSASNPGVYTGRFGIRNNHPSSSYSYWVLYRYITATDRPFIYAIRDKNGEITNLWACEDPPQAYWGLKEKPENFVPPLKVYDNSGLIIPYEEIIIFDYDLDEYRALINRANEDKRTLHEMLSNEYELLTENKIFTLKNLSMI